MSNDRQTQTDYFAPLRRAITVILLLSLFGLFVLWRIDSPRVEKFRALVIDTFVPSFEWILRPMTSVVKLAQDYQSYEKYTVNPYAFAWNVTHWSPHLLSQKFL